MGWDLFLSDSNTEFAQVKSQSSIATNSPWVLGGTRYQLLLLGPQPDHCSWLGCHHRGSSPGYSALWLLCLFGFYQLYYFYKATYQNLAAFALLFFK